MSTVERRGHLLDREGIRTDRVKWNLSAAALYEEAIRKQEGVIAAEGPLVCRTGSHTGRSPNDKFVVREPSSEQHIGWGKVNKPMEQAQWDTLHADFINSLAGKELYALDCYAGADATYRLPVRIISEYAWHNLFCRNLFIDDPAAAAAQAPEFTVIDSPNFKADPARHGTRSEVVIALNFAKKLVLIGGTSYAGEMKNDLQRPQPSCRSGTSSRCTARLTSAGQRRFALFFGLSARARRRSRRSRRGSSSETTRTRVGATAASSTSKAAATRRPSGCRPKPSRRFTPRRGGSARCSKTWSSIPRPAR
jgi:phosphoenolpyruvate carboxykinase (ATP)